MDKEKIIRAYEVFTSEISKFTASLKSHTSEIGKGYSVFINLLHDLKTSVTLLEEKKKIGEKELADLNGKISDKKSLLQKLLKEGDDAINKQKEDFEKIKKTEINRISSKDKEANERLQNAYGLLAEARKKEAENKDKENGLTREKSQFDKTKQEYEAKNEDLSQREEKLRLGLISFQNREAQIKVDLANITKHREYVAQKEKSLKSLLADIETKNKIIEVNLANCVKEKNEILVLKKELDDKASALTKLENDLNAFKKNLDDRDKNLTAYKEEIDYKMALLKQDLEKERRELVLGKK